MMSARDAWRSYQRALARHTKALRAGVRDLDAYKAISDEITRRWKRADDLGAVPFAICIAIDRDAGVITYEHFRNRREYVRSAFR
jgi:hypothetical protein